jgi:hypothetical protein
VHAEEAGVQEQVAQRDGVQAARGERVVLALDRLAHLRHRRLGDRGLVAERLGVGGLHVAHDRPRTNEAITNDSSACVLVTCAPNSREANFSVVPRSLGRANSTGPAVVLT